MSYVQRVLAIASVTLVAGFYLFCEASVADEGPPFLSSAKLTDLCESDTQPHDPSDPTQLYHFDWERVIHNLLMDKVSIRLLLDDKGGSFIDEIAKAVSQKNGQLYLFSEYPKKGEQPFFGQQICEERGACTGNPDHKPVAADRNGQQAKNRIDSAPTEDPQCLADQCKIDKVIGQLVPLHSALLELEKGKKKTVAVGANVQISYDNQNKLACWTPGQGYQTPKLAAGSKGLAAISKFSQEHVRIVNAPSELLVPSDPTADEASPVSKAYPTGAGAKLSFSEDSGSAQVSNQVIGVFGLQFPVKLTESPNWDMILTPYAYIDREEKLTNIHDQAPKQQFSQNFWGGGLSASLVNSLEDSKFQEFTNLQEIIWGARPDYQFNYCNNTQLASLNTTALPVGQFGNLINRLTNVTPSSQAWQIAILFNLQTNFGWYQHRAPATPVLTVNTLCQSTKASSSAPVFSFNTDPRVAQDYVRPGAQGGISFELRCLIPAIGVFDQGFLCLPDNPLNLSATYTDFYPVTGFRKSLGYFDTLGKWKIGEGISINAEYSNGRRPDNTLRYEAWSIGLGFTF